MRKLILLFTLLVPFLPTHATKPSGQEIVMQLVKNVHGGMEVHNIDGKTSYSGYVGTGYIHYFAKNKAYLKPEIDIKWGEYRYEGGYALQTTSLMIPVTVGYNLFRNETIGMNIFGGIRYEQILQTSQNNYSSKVNNSQVGLNAGTSIRLLNFVSLNVSYYHGLTSLFRDGTGKISSFSFSFNF
jgi:hypothetical protein